MFATARLLQLPDVPLVCFNGALGLRCTAAFLAGEEPEPLEVFSTPVPDEAARAVLRHAAQRGELVQYYAGRSIHVACQTDDHLALTREYAALTGVDAHVYDESYQRALSMGAPFKMLLMTRDVDTTLGAAQVRMSEYNDWHVCVCVCVYVCIYIYIFIHPSIYLSIHPSIQLSIYLCMHTSPNLRSNAAEHAQPRELSRRPLIQPEEPTVTTDTTPPPVPLPDGANGANSRPPPPPASAQHGRPQSNLVQPSAHLDLEQHTARALADHPGTRRAVVCEALLRLFGRARHNTQLPLV